MAETIIAEGSPVRWRHGFGHRKGIVQSYVETHDAYLIEQGGSVHRVPADRVTALAKPRRMVGRVTRRGTAERPQGVPQPKPAKRWESEAYLTFVRAQGYCIAPGCQERLDIEASHYGPDAGKSRKASDMWAAPVCRVHHREWWHQKGHFPGMTADDSKRLHMEASARLMARWIARGERGA